MFTRWNTISRRTGSILCAGIDPAFNAHTPATLLSFLISYIDSVYPHVSAFKINHQFFRQEHEQRALETILQYIHDRERETLVIDDSKYQDIGNSSREGIIRTHIGGHYHLATVCQFPGNLNESIYYLGTLGVGCISICLMSNQQYSRQKNMLIELTGEEKIKTSHTVRIDRTLYAPKYLYDASTAHSLGAAGVVVGATGHVTAAEIRRIDSYTPHMLFLVPGYGSVQGGGLEKFVEAGVMREKLIVNVGRGLMYCNGTDSTPPQQSQAARALNRAINHTLNTTTDEIF